MILDVDERSSSFFDENEEKQILSELKVSGLQSNHSQKHTQVGHHLKRNESFNNLPSHDFETEASFYAVERAQSVSDLQQQDKANLHILRVMHC
jgi:hypothetical protein